MADFFIISVDNGKIALNILMDSFLSPGDSLMNQGHHYLGNQFDHQLLKWYINSKWFCGFWMGEIWQLVIL